jgi:hypothetical protein
MSVDNEDQVNPFDQYSDYEKIESHLEFSKTLFALDLKGQHILLELERKKSLSRKKKTFGEDIYRIYHNLVDVLNVKKLKPRLYCALLHFLDELVFKEVSNYDQFFIEDDGFQLTKLYFGQTSWIRDQDIQPFELDTGQDLNINEAMFLVCYLREYENFLLSIEEYISDLDYIGLKRELTSTIGRIRRKLKIVWDIVIEVVTKSLQNDANEKI